ncbi:MAG: DUF1501 domain-containing protein [Planctomycetota bacterium]
MNHNPHDSNLFGQDPACCSRRHLLKAASGGFAWLAFSAMLAGKLPLPSYADPEPGAAGGQDTIPKPKARAKRVIFLCMQGAPSHVDTFDYKPTLIASDGKSFSRNRGRVSGNSKLLAPQWKFYSYGKSGLPISELFPNVGKHADKLCLLNSMSTDLPDHGRAQLKLHTGNSQFIRPSMGAWVIYGLGSENENLPGYITINPGGGSQNYGAGFLPAEFQGMPVPMRGRSEAQLRYMDNPRLKPKNQRVQLDFVQDLNKHHMQQNTPGGDQAIEGVIKSYEMAFRMQADAPKLMDIESEPQAVKAAYGIGNGDTDGFGRQCLLARRLSEAGVRFVEVQNGGWDHHRNLSDALPDSCRKIDQPIGALLADLESRGLLDETLVIWGGEFGRTPYSQNSNGRDHNNKGYTLWMAGGGVKGGMRYGATDEVGYEAVENKIDIHDVHATILHLMGIDHEMLTYRYAGRDFRLTDVFGHVLKDIVTA